MSPEQSPSRKGGAKGGSARQNAGNADESRNDPNVPRCDFRTDLAARKRLGA